MTDRRVRSSEQRVRSSEQRVKSSEQRVRSSEQRVRFPKQRVRSSEPRDTPRNGLASRGLQVRAIDRPRLPAKGSRAMNAKVAAGPRFPALLTDLYQLTMA